jgi:hypothetical protein
VSKYWSGEIPKEIHSMILGAAVYAHHEYEERRMPIY